MDGCLGGFGGFALVGGEGAKGNKGTTVNSACIIQECLNNSVDAPGVGGVEAWGGILWIGELDFGSILWCVVLVR